MPLTATVTEASLAYVVTKLNMVNFSLIKGSNNRKNISNLSQDLIHSKTMISAFAKCFKSTIGDLKENSISAERDYFSHRHCCEVYEYFETG